MSEEETRLIPAALAMTLMDASGRPSVLVLKALFPNARFRQLSVPFTPEQVAERTEFAAKWNALVKRGIDTGMLDEVWDDSTDGAGYTLNMDTHTSVQEPNPDYDPDWKPPTHIEIPISRLPRSMQ